MAVSRHLPPDTQWISPKGGLYLWLRLPESGPTAAELYINAVEAGVAYAMGTVFFPNSDGSYHLRINFGAHKPQDIEEGLRRLGRAWRELQQQYVNMERTPLL
jgi:DNA-binding transcriptional MocR family regulator